MALIFWTKNVIINTCSTLYAKGKISPKGSIIGYLIGIFLKTPHGGKPSYYHTNSISITRWRRFMILHNIYPTYICFSKFTDCEDKCTFYRTWANNSSIISLLWFFAGTQLNFGLTLKAIYFVTKKKDRRKLT